MFVSLTAICHISPLCDSFIATLQLGLLDCHNSTKMLEQTCVTYNEVWRSWKYQDFFVKTKTKTFRQDQDQDQDFYFKTKTIFHVLEAPRDQDQAL